MLNAPLTQEQQIAMALLRQMHEEGHLSEFHQWPPTEEQILEFMGVDREAAYEQLERLREAIAVTIEENLLRAAFRFLAENPGAVRTVNGGDGVFSDAYREFVVGTMRPGGLADGVSTDVVARTTHVPAAVLQQWREAANL